MWSALWGAIVFGAIVSTGCAHEREPHPSITAAWRDYEALPAERALAVAGDLSRGPWVAGMSGGHAAPADAREGALRECRKRRRDRRLQAPCLVYALGDELIGRR